jgi:hypothetical protein
LYTNYVPQDKGDKGKWVKFALVEGFQGSKGYRNPQTDRIQNMLQLEIRQVSAPVAEITMLEGGNLDTNKKHAYINAIPCSSAVPVFMRRVSKTILLD